MLREETSGAAGAVASATGKLHLQPVAPMVPRAHLNGTGRPGLLNPLVEVMARGSAFIDALAAAAPHARDYYVIGDAAYPQARVEHEARLRRAKDLLAEIEAIAMAVYDQGRGRERAA